MTNTPQKKKTSTAPTFGRLLKEGKELVSSYEQFEGNVVSLMDAQTRNDNSTRDSQNRSKIALIFSTSFIAILGAIIILAPIYNATIGEKTPIDQTRLIESFGSIFGPILGFV